MRIEQLIYILEVARQNSISQAAKKLYISQPSLSAAISNLEEELKTKIFDRTLTGVKPTHKGKVILGQAQAIVNEVEKLKHICAEKSDILNGDIAISTLPALSNFILLEVFAIFKQEHPGVNMIIKEDDNFNIIQELESGSADIGLIGLFPYETEEFLTLLNKKNLCYQELFTDELNIYAGKNHPLLNRKGIYLKDTHDFPMIIYRNNITQKDFAELNLNFSNVVRFNDRESMKKMVGSSNALTILPKIISLNDLYVISGHIAPLDMADFDIPLSLGIVFNRRHYLSDIQREFIKVLNDTCAKHWPQ